MMAIKEDNSILLVDVDASVLGLIEEASADLAKVTHFRDGQEAAEFLKSHSPKLVVVAEHLPGLSGKQIINGMRYTKHLKHIPAILVSQSSKQNFKDATLTLSLPLRPEQLQGYVAEVLQADLVAEPAKQKVEEKLKKPKHIFMVEDSQTVSALLQHILTKEGFKVSKAESFEAAKKLIQKDLSQFDLAILDIYLPGGTGLELLELIRTRSQLPAIILSSVQEREHIEKSYALGAQAFIPKPFNPRELLKRLKDYLA